MPLLRAFVLFCLALGLSACMTERPLMQTGVPQDMTIAALEPLNAFRAKNGLKPVVADQALMKVAYRQVQAMASNDVLSHEVDGDFAKRVNAAGFSQADAAENVGAGHPTVENAIQDWIASPHHRDNMLLKNATGIAVVRIDAPQSRYKSYWALEIASGPTKARIISSFQLSSMPLLPHLFNN